MSVLLTEVEQREGSLGVSDLTVPGFLTYLSHKLSDHYLELKSRER